MKQLTIFLFAVSIALFTACTNDDDAPTTTPEENVSQHVVSIDYTNSRMKDKDIFEYDEQGRIIHIEMNDSNESLLTDRMSVYNRGIHKKVLADHKTIDYKYDLENGKIYILTARDFSNLSEFEYYTGITSTIRYNYDTLFVSNNRIDSIHSKPSLLRDGDVVGRCLYKMYFTYSDDNRLIGMKKIDLTAPKSPREYIYTYTWENGNIINSRHEGYDTYNGKVYYTQEWTYSDVKGFLPTYNVFNTIYDISLLYGILADQGLFGEKTKNLLASCTPSDCYEFTYWEEGAKSGPVPKKDDIVYTFNGDKVATMTINTTMSLNDETYTTPYRNMAITWR